MSLRVVECANKKEYVRAFLELPRRLYGRGKLVQSKKEEAAILAGTHVLSHYFTADGIVVLDEQNRAVSRGILTVYEGDENAYLGFFESVKEKEASQLLFKKAEELAKKRGCKAVVGPVDASFFIKYRLKINRFEDYYTGEPYNRDYYLKLWQSAGYTITDKYYSNHYGVVPKEASDAKFAARLKDKEAEGYVIKSPSKENFDSTLEEVYDLLIELYRSFPVYKHITKEEFTALYSYLKYIIRYNMVKMAYYKGKAVGFFISIPNYRNVVYGRLTLSDYIKILRIHARPKDYVMLYMGVDFAHKGLGKAMAEVIKEELKEEGVPSVGALIRQGNINKDYFAQIIDYEYEYVLLRKDLEQ